jgi:hypothetical protein
MVLVMTMCAPKDLLIPYTPAHAATITSGTYISTERAIPLGGTILDVAAMLADAVLNGQTEAVCTFTRPTFDDTLTIKLPTTATAWTAANIPLRLLIQDGTSGTTLPSGVTHITITGVLALSSSITITGGTYSFGDRFLQLPSGIAIRDGSSFTVERGAYRLRVRLDPRQESTLVDVQGGGIRLENASTLAISDNSMVASNVNAIVTSWVCTMLASVSPITISTNSTLASFNNNMVVSNVRVSFWRVNTIYSSITISNTSTLAISNSGRGSCRGGGCNAVSNPAFQVGPRCTRVHTAIVQPAKSTIGVVVTGGDRGNGWSHEVDDGR